jgi:hypothetical protein
MHGVADDRASDHERHELASLGRHVDYQKSLSSISRLLYGENA